MTDDEQRRVRREAYAWCAEIIKSISRDPMQTGLISNSNIRFWMEVERIRAAMDAAGAVEDGPVESKVGSGTTNGAKTDTDRP